MTQTAPLPAASGARPAAPLLTADADSRRRAPARDGQPFAMFEATLERAAPAPLRAAALPLADAMDLPAAAAEPPQIADSASPGPAPAALAAASAPRDPGAALAAALALAAPPSSSAPSPRQGETAPRPAPVAGPALESPPPVTRSPPAAAPPQTAGSFEAAQTASRAALSRAEAAPPADAAALVAAPDFNVAVETHLLPARWPQAVDRIVAAADETRAAAAGAPAAPDAQQRPAVGLLRLTLEPERLGAVTVTLRLRGDALEARLATERPETAALLEARRAELSDALRRAGYEIEQLSFTPAPPAVEPARRGEAAREAAHERREPGEQRRDDGAQEHGGRRGGDQAAQEDRDARRRWRGLRRDDLDAG